MFTSFSPLGPASPSVRPASEPPRASYRDNQGAWALRVAWEGGNLATALILDLVRAVDFSQPAALLEAENRLYALLARHVGDFVIAAIIAAAYYGPRSLAVITPVLATF
jgi:hypothetical protein